MTASSLAVTVRRLHDTGRCGWWVCLSIIPFIGAMLLGFTNRHILGFGFHDLNMLTIIGEIVILIFCIINSQPGPNKYGPNPKGSLLPPPPPVASDNNDFETKLRSLAKLRDEGIITNEDFERKKNSLLGS